MKTLKKIGLNLDSLGMKIYDLLDTETGKSVPFYADYLHKLAEEQTRNRNQSQNTIDAIASDLKVFFEYIFNAQDVFFEQNLSTASTILADIILSFPDYLTLGSLSTKPIAKNTAKLTKYTPIGPTSANRYLSSVNSFVEASAIAHERLKEAQNIDLINVDVPLENIHSSLLKRRKLRISERKKLREQSVLSQVISGGAKYTRTSLFSTVSKSKGTSKLNHFPIPYIAALLDSATTYRDRALWALLLGAGLRVSEACQLLLDDVDIVNNALKVFTYRDRIKCFEGIKPEDVSKLSFKGRATEEVYFIYPFNEIFFESIIGYLKHERQKGLQHNYLFVTNSNRSRGRPLFASSRSNRGWAFKNAQVAIDCPLKNDDEQKHYTLHSLRHFYGYWLLNFHQTPQGNGFSILEVQEMMGHSQLSSTKKYAVIDKIIAKEKMRLANLALEEQPKNKSNNLFLNQQRELFLRLAEGC